MSQNQYPTKLRLFKAWAKAMEEGATVDKPNYSKSTSTRRSSTRAKTRPRRTRRRKKHAKTQD